MAAHRAEQMSAEAFKEALRELGEDRGDVVHAVTPFAGKETLPG
jgi:hypothetical protein